ncbi:MAG TPA: HGxxPAAW family protein [Actinospica sp.]|nr:HGxxPAAW family protein [Actinospica sp.]
MTEAEAVEALQAPKGRSAFAQVAGVGMALMGSSLPSSAEAHVDHGYAPARWAAVSVSGLGWIIGGVALPLGNIPLVVLGGVLQVVAVVVNLAMNAAGLGALANDQWAEAKAAAKAVRSVDS